MYSLRENPAGELGEQHRGPWSVIFLEVGDLKCVSSGPPQSTLHPHTDPPLPIGLGISSSLFLWAFLSERKQRGHLVVQAIASVAAVTRRATAGVRPPSLPTHSQIPSPSAITSAGLVDLTGDVTQTFILEESEPFSGHIAFMATAEGTRRHLSGSLGFHMFPPCPHYVKAMSPPHPTPTQLNRVNYPCWILFLSPVVLDAQNAKRHGRSCSL